MSPDRPDLDAIEALLTAATPEPWLADLDIFDPDDHEIEACVSNADVRILFTSGTGYTYGEAPEVERAAAWAAAKASQQMTDARLIAAAPTALREVIAYARALEQERHEVQARHDAGSAVASGPETGPAGRAAADAAALRLGWALLDPAAVDGVRVGGGS